MRHFIKLCIVTFLRQLLRLGDVTINQRKKSGIFAISVENSGFYRDGIASDEAIVAGIGRGLPKNRPLCFPWEPSEPG